MLMKLKNYHGKLFATTDKMPGEPDCAAAVLVIQAIAITHHYLNVFFATISCESTQKKI